MIGFGLTLFLLLLAPTALAQNTAVGLPIPSFTSEITQITDPEKTASAQEVAEWMQTRAEPFRSIPQVYSSSRYWYHFKVDAYRYSWILNIENRSPSHLALYVRGGNQWQAIKCQSLALSPHPRCVMPPLDQETEYLLSIDYSNTTSLLLHADPNPPPSRGLADLGLVLNLFMVAFGFALVFFLGVFGWNFRDLNYIYFALYALTGLFYTAIGVGIVQIMGWPYLLNESLSWIGCLSVIFASLFAMNHLQTRRLAPLAHKIFWGILLLTVLQMLVNGWSKYPLFNLGYTPEVMSLLLIIAAIGTGLRVRRYGIEGLNYFLAAWGVFVFFSILLLTRQYGLWQSDSLIAKSLLRIGTTSLLTILALSVAKRAQMERQRLMDSLESTNNRLETEVRQRTQQILDQQETLIQTAKMASIGEIAGGIAHEINNPLAIIAGYSYALNLQAKKGHVNPDQVTHFHERIGASIQRIAVIVRSLNLFSTEVSLDENTVLDIQPVILDFIQLISARFNQNGIEVKAPSSIPGIQVYGSIGKIDQILINILNNALDAVAHSKNPWVEIECTESADQLAIHITDSGRGIEQEIAQKIFDPFFTTKEVGKGTGLGLSISKKIAESMNGSLSYGICQGHTRFTLTLQRRISLQKSVI